MKAEEPFFEWEITILHVYKGEGILFPEVHFRGV